MYLHLYVVSSIVLIVYGVILGMNNYLAGLDAYSPDRFGNPSYVIYSYVYIIADAFVLTGTLMLFFRALRRNNLFGDF
ncbi:MAG: hypothetical protein Q4G68_09865 [Planctomycetia bacterium]|nr:hypothetical protein [Planctomycetia bacterium]